MRDNSAGAWSVEAGDEIEERGFSGTGAAEKSEEFAVRDSERDIVDRADDGFAHDVVAGNGFEANGGWQVGHRL